MRRALLILGTRPEAIKLAPVYRALRAHGTFDVALAVTGQHREMLADALRVLRISPDYDLDLMQQGQVQLDLIAAMLPGLGSIIGRYAPDCVVVQGDTTSTFIGALAAYLNRVPVAHVEAGLRTGDKYAPYPEEVYRRLVADIAEHHFAPTARAADNLRAEGIADNRIHLTGNTAIDALHWILAHTSPELPPTIAANVPDLLGRRFVLITCHRRESFGAEMTQIMAAIASLAARFPTVPFVFPVHLNPQVAAPARASLHGLPNVLLTAPLDYAAFAHLLARCHLVMTDSGGIQEEAVELGKPTLVMRRMTERQEGIDTGTAILTGLAVESIVSHAVRLLTDDDHYRRIAVPSRVYGDGHAADAIARILYRALEGAQ